MPAVVKKRYMELLREGYKGAAAARVAGVFLDAIMVKVRDNQVEGQRVIGWREALNELDGAYLGRLR